MEQKTPSGLEAEEWQILRRVVDLIKANAPGGELGPTLELIEIALRADAAKMRGAMSRAAGLAGVEPPTAHAGRCYPPVAADQIQRPRAGAVSVAGTNLWIC